MTYSVPSATLMAPGVFIAFPFVVIVLFLTLAPRRAVVFSGLIATLLLPEGGFAFKGFPEYTKYTAIAVVWLAAVLLDGGRPLRIAPRWFDLPMIVWCFSRVPASLSNQLGLYDGLSSSLDVFFPFGFAYWLGRTYFADREGIHELARGMLWGALLYMPLCLWEIRFSPHLNANLYGFRAVSFQMLKRYDGFMPMVFMANPLQLSLWMGATGVLAWWASRTRAIRRIWRVPTYWLAWGLLLTTLLTKSRGALVVAIVGVLVYVGTRATKTSLALVAVAGIAASYPVVRGSGLLDADRISSAAAVVFSQRRVTSLGVRLRSEDMYIEHVKARPIFGWGGFGRGEVVVDGVRTVPDGLWAIALSRSGWSSVVVLAVIYLMPAIFLVRRLRPRLWLTPEHGAGVGLAVMLVLYWIDCLMNAMLNPMLLLAIGAATGWFGSRKLLEPAGQTTREPPRDRAPKLARLPRLADLTRRSRSSR